MIREYIRNREVINGTVFPEGMHRVAIGVEYSGVGFFGFQRQKRFKNTVQAKLEHALTYVAQEEITLVCAGRTDSGVHATGQVVHFDTLANRPSKAWVLGVNTKLPDGVRVHWSQEVPPDFHARFSAGNRIYRYVFYCGPVRPATLGKLVTYTPYDLDFSLMEEASKHLVGEHDFSSFRASHCQAHTPVRDVQSIQWFKQGQLHVMEITANAFLHHMVRNIVGTLMEVGRKKQPVSWVKQVLDSCDRKQAGSTAEPEGLYLVGVEYPERFNLPKLSLGPTYLGF